MQRFIGRRASRSNLRPVVIIVACFSAIWGIIVAATYLRRRNDAGTPSKLALIYIVLAILYFVAAGIEIFGILAAWKSSIRFARTYFWGSAVVALIVTGAELIRTVVHFTEKSSIIDTCKQSYANDISNGGLSSSDVATYCKDSWNNMTYFDIALLIFSILLSLFFASLAASFLYQLQNPQTLRTHAVNAANSAQYAYPLQPYSGGMQPPYPASAMPYGGPAPPLYTGGADATHLPSYDNPYGIHPSDEKLGSDAGPYAPPPGPPPQAQNPFADQVEHAPPVRRDGESAESFEQKQHEYDQRMRAGESTETVTLEPRRS
ncbi:hypothetical protein NBRC10512_004097 [Rhodotorula toruloides]